jgi:hypothetical protein
MKRGDVDTRRLAILEAVRAIRDGQSCDAALAAGRRIDPAMCPQGIDAELLGMMKDYAKTMRPNR